MRELLSLKAHGTIRGDMLVKMEETLKLPKSEAFAPTGRHNTLKLNIAASCARAAVGDKTKCVRRHMVAAASARTHGEVYTRAPTLPPKLVHCSLVGDSPMLPKT